MKLWHLDRMYEVGYDEYDAFIIWAKSEERAREIAALKRGDEAEDEWLSPNRSRCLEVESDGNEGIVLSSFCAA